MKEYNAFNNLKKRIDDFNETCPLLELMANKAMKERHWERMEGVSEECNREMILPCPLGNWSPF